jgi:hypothetical protein
MSAEDRRESACCFRLPLQRLSFSLWEPMPLRKFQMPLPPAAKRPIVTIHAKGAQTYECKVDAGGKLAWQSASRLPPS